MYKILIADDELVIRNSLKRLIEKTGLPVSVKHSVSNGEEVLSCLQSSQCDIAFIDINMPKLNGLEVLKHLKQLDRQLYIIVVSGYDSFSYAREAINLGVKKYLLKPVSFEDMNETLKEAIAELEKFQTQYTISILDVENIITDLVTAITERNPEYKNIIHDAISMISKLEPAIAVKFSDELTELIYNRLNFNIGFTLSCTIEKCKVSEIESVTKAFSQNINLLYSVIDQVYQNIQENVIDRAVETLDKGENFNLTLEQIADSFGYNPLYFGRLFKKITGEGFTQYKTKKCIKNAEHLLLYTNMSITEIAQKLNFNDSAYFTTIFKKHTSLSPKAFREQKGIITEND